MKRRLARYDSLPKPAIDRVLDQFKEIQEAGELNPEKQDPKRGKGV